MHRRAGRVGRRRARGSAAGSWISASEVRDLNVHDAMDDARIGQILGAIRRRRGWRQADLAGIVGISQSSVSRVERGTSTDRPSVRCGVSRRRSTRAPGSMSDGAVDSPTGCSMNATQPSESPSPPGSRRWVGRSSRRSPSSVSASAARSTCSGIVTTAVPSASSSTSRWSTRSRRRSGDSMSRPGSRTRSPNADWAGDPASWAWCSRSRTRPRTGHASRPSNRSSGPGFPPRLARCAHGWRTRPNHCAGPGSSPSAAATRSDDWAAHECGSRVTAAVRSRMSGASRGSRGRDTPRTDRPHPGPAGVLGRVRRSPSRSPQGRPERVPAGTRFGARPAPRRVRTDRHRPGPRPIHVAGTTRVGDPASRSRGTPGPARHLVPRSARAPRRSIDRDPSRPPGRSSHVMSTPWVSPGPRPAG